MSSNLSLTYKDKRLILDISQYIRSDLLNQSDCEVMSENIYSLFYSISFYQIDLNDLKFLTDVKEKTFEKIQEILINTEDRTDEIFFSVSIFNDASYHQTMMNECLKYLEEALDIRFKFLRSSLESARNSTVFQYLCQKCKDEDDFTETKYFSFI